MKVADLSVEVLQLASGEACTIRNTSKKPIDLTNAEIILDFDDGSAVPLAVIVPSNKLPPGSHITLWAGEKPPNVNNQGLGLFRVPRGFLLAGAPEARVVAGQLGTKSPAVPKIIAAAPPAVRLAGEAPKKQEPVPSPTAGGCAHCGRPLNVVGICVNTDCSGG